MKTFNQVILNGHVGGDPKIHNFPNGGQKAVISLATNTGFGDKQRTQWHQLVFFNKAAQIVSKLVKGNYIQVVGKLEYLSWTDQEGNTRKSVEIWVDDFIIITGEVGTVTNESPSMAPQQAGYANMGQGYNQAHASGNADDMDPPY